MILVSPELLYRFEHSQAQARHPVKGPELATRPSYLAGLPDAELLRLGRTAAC